MAEIGSRGGVGAQPTASAAKQRQIERRGKKTSHSVVVFFIRGLSVRSGAMMKQLQGGWEARGQRLQIGNLSGGHSLLTQLRAAANGERIIVTWAGTAPEVREIVEANDRMSFLLALSTELALIRSPQELVCTAM